MIVSVVVPLLFWVFIGTRNALQSGLPGMVVDYLSLYDFSSILSSGNIFLFLVNVVIIYLIWSLFQKKKVVQVI